MYQQIIQKHITDEVETDSRYHGLDSYSVERAAASLDTIIKNDLISRIEALENQSFEGWPDKCKDGYITATTTIKNLIINNNV
jgi:hypothetical protein